MSSAVSSEDSAQPWTATLPSRASRPTATGRVTVRRLAHQSRIAHRGGADDHAVDAFVEPALDRRHVADAAAELHLDVGRLQDAVDRLGIDRLAGKGAVEIDNVQILKSGELEGIGLLGRIAMEHGRARHVALLEAHAEAVF